MSTIYEIYPPIGVARVGNSMSEFYIAPERSGALPELPDGKAFDANDFRDASGAVRRQAARFQIIATDTNKKDSPRVLSLESPEVRAIHWKVHLANKKAGWYTFATNRGEDGYASNHPWRNAKVSLEQRHTLFIDPGPREIVATAKSPTKPVPFSRSNVPKGYAAQFPPENLQPFSIDTLGELRTDTHGHLLVLGGLGRSGSSTKPKITEYANNDDWWDDTSDGSIQATIEFNDGSRVEASGAWVLVGPPAYAPQIVNLVTLYDTIFDISVRKLGSRPDIFEGDIWHSGPDGFRPNFARDIKPLLARGEGYPWVVAIPPKPHRFDWDKLGNTDKAYNSYRRYFLDVLRGPSDENTLISGTSGATMMPYLAGDDAIGAADQTTSKFLRLTDTQYFMLQQWADGFFDASSPPAEDIREALTRGVLENCVGGAFSPGIEMTWVSRLAQIYTEPFRIRHKASLPSPLGTGFTPLAGLEPGDVTKFMAVPWQADFNECSSQPVEGRIVWWWPAQRPAFVYLDGQAPDNAREPNLLDGPQVPWIGSDYDQNASDYISFADDLEMVHSWDQLGFVYGRDRDGERTYVEVARTLPRRGNERDR